jgi:hypothetical protein
MKYPAAEILKQQIPLLDYVEGQDWKPARRIARGRLMGLCPLHVDRKRRYPEGVPALTPPAHSSPRIAVCGQRNWLDVGIWKLRPDYPRVTPQCRATWVITKIISTRSQLFLCRSRCIQAGCPTWIGLRAVAISCCW